MFWMSLFSCGSLLHWLGFSLLCCFLGCWPFSSSFFPDRQCLLSDQVFSSNLHHVILPRLNLILVAYFVILCQLHVHLRCGTDCAVIYMPYNYEIKQYVIIVRPTFFWWLNRFLQSSNSDFIFAWRKNSSRTYHWLMCKARKYNSEEGISSCSCSFLNSHLIPSTCWVYCWIQGGVWSRFSKRKQIALNVQV